MNCLAFVPTKNGQPARLAWKPCPTQSNVGTVTALVVGELNGDGGAGAAGASKVLHVGETFKTKAKLRASSRLPQKQKGPTLWLRLTTTLVGRWPRVAVRMGAGMVPGVTGLL